MLDDAAAAALVAARLGDTPRARHSLFVGHVMRDLALATDGDAALWYATGLCHDLDYFETAADRSRHGLVAAEWLEGRLPEEALAAIRAHDHRTGMTSETPLAHALRLADALAIACDVIGPTTSQLLAGPDATARLSARLDTRPWLVPLIVDSGEALGLDLPSLAVLLADAPPPA